MRREYATFRSLTDLFNWISADGRTKVVFVCSSRATLNNEVAALTDISHPPTLNQLSMIGKIRLHYVPAISHLCAALSAAQGLGSSDDDTSEVSKLVILNLMSLYLSGSSQRLSQVVSLAVEAADMAGLDLLLAECCIQTELRHPTERDGSGNSNGWQEQLSILAPRHALPSTRQPWAARTVTAEQVVSRWCDRIEPSDNVNLFRG